MCIHIYTYIFLPFSFFFPFVRLRLYKLRNNEYRSLKDGEIKFEKVTTKMIYVHVIPKFSKFFKLITDIFNFYWIHFVSSSDHSIRSPKKTREKVKH